MDEKVVDLLTLRDTLEIMPNDPYQDIYDKVEAELYFGEFEQRDLEEPECDRLKLFWHCLKTCQEIFEVSEFRYGKAAKDIPRDFWNEIVTLYVEKACYMIEEESSTKTERKYDYFIPYTNYSKGNCSIADLADVILHSSNYCLDKDSKRIELWKINKNYLSRFFGIKYDDKCNSRAVKYETLRLLKILHDCIWECEIDLGYILRMSFLRQNSKIPSSYSDALNFIRERIIVKNPDCDYFQYFNLIMDLEKYNNFVRSFINAFGERIIEYVLRQITPLNSSVKRFVCENVYKNIIDNIKNMPSTEVQKYDCADYIQCYAYEHFLMADIIDEEYSEFYSQIFVVEAEEDFYIRAKSFLTSNRIETVSLEDFSAFAGKYKKKLAKVIHSNIRNDSELRKFSVRIERHKENYVDIGRVYNLGINRDEFSELSGLEAVAIVYLYERLADAGTDIPLHSGYIGAREENKQRRDLKIKALMEQIHARLTNEEIKVPLSDEEYFLACVWLTEQMHTLINYLTIEIKTLREKMKSALLKYWRETVPLLPPTGRKVNLEELIEKILPIPQRQVIITKAIQIQSS